MCFCSIRIYFVSFPAVSHVSLHTPPSANISVAEVNVTLHWYENVHVLCFLKDVSCKNIICCSESHNYYVPFLTVLGFLELMCRFQWPRGLRRVRSGCAWTLGSWARLALEPWIYIRVFFLCYVVY